MTFNPFELPTRFCVEDSTADRDRMIVLLGQVVDPDRLRASHEEAARRLLHDDGRVYPADGCAVMLSVLMQGAGMTVPDLYWALDVPPMLMARGWTEIPFGCQRGGDIGSTCGEAPRHGEDHVYVVVRAVNQDEMVVVDHQASYPHFRWASAAGGQTPTLRFFRAPDPEAPPPGPPVPSPARQ